MVRCSTPSRPVRGGLPRHVPSRSLRCPHRSPACGDRDRKGPCVGRSRRSGTSDAPRTASRAAGPVGHGSRIPCRPNPPYEGADPRYDEPVIYAARSAARTDSASKAFRVIHLVNAAAEYVGGRPENLTPAAVRRASMSRRMRDLLRKTSGAAYEAISANPIATQLSHETPRAANAATTSATTTTTTNAPQTTLPMTDDRTRRARNGSSAYSPQLAELTVTYPSQYVKQVASLGVV